MELEEMKNIWDSQFQIPDLTLNRINKERHWELRKKMKNFQISEVIGFIVAYLLAAVILYHFSQLDTWYLKLCGVILLTYFLLMPLYTIAIIKRLGSPDLILSSYKEILEHFYTIQKKLNRVEQISFIISPLLYISSTILLTKIYVNLDVFNANPKVWIVIVSAFILSTLFNMWSFRKRKTYFLSTMQLLEDNK